MEDTDLLLVERSGTSYKLETQNMSNLRDDDLLLVERAGVSYKVTADQVNTGPTGLIGQPVSVLTPLNGAGLNEGEDYQPLSTAITTVEAGGSVSYTTDAITTVDSYSLWNQDEHWPAGGQNDMRSPWSNAFDGNLTTGATPNVNRTQSCVFGNIICDKLEFYTNNSGGTVKLHNNDADVTSVLVNNEWADVTAFLPSDKIFSGVTLSTPSGGPQPALKAIRANGLILVSSLSSETPPTAPKLIFLNNNNFDKFEVGDVVQAPDVKITEITTTGVPTIKVDGGSWLGADGSGSATPDGRYEPSQSWSDSLSGNNLVDPLNAFDGDPDTYADTSSGWTLDLSSYTFGTGAHNISVKVGGASTITVNNTTNLSPAGNSGAVEWSGSVTGELTTISADGPGPSFYYIAIDGKRLVNTAVPGGLGATNISKVNKFDATLTFTDDTELANMVGPLTMVKANGEIDQEITSDIVNASNFNKGVSARWGFNPSGYPNAIDGRTGNCFNSEGLDYDGNGQGGSTSGNGGQLEFNFPSTPVSKCRYIRFNCTNAYSGGVSIKTDAGEFGFNDQSPGQRPGFAPRGLYDCLEIFPGFENATVVTGVTAYSGMGCAIQQFYGEDKSTTTDMEGEFQRLTFDNQQAFDTFTRQYEVQNNVYFAYTEGNDMILQGRGNWVGTDGSVVGDGVRESVVRGPATVATANNIVFQDGNNLGITDLTGTWLTNYYAKGTEITASAPSPSSIVFTSMNDGTTDFTAIDASLSSRTWTLEQGNSAQGPWTTVGTYIDYAASASQDGATPWDNPALEANKFYQVKVQYNSENAASISSLFNTFKTGDA